MADKKLNEVTKVTDMAYVPVIMADGSVGQISKADLASVVAGIIGTAKDNKNGLLSENMRQNAFSHSKYWIDASSVLLVASIQEYDIVELSIATGEASYGFNSSVNGYVRVLINNRNGITTNQIKKEIVVNDLTLYFKKNGAILNVYVKTSTATYNYVLSKCNLSLLGIETNKILKMEKVNEDVSSMTAI